MEKGIRVLGQNVNGSIITFPSGEVIIVDTLLNPEETAVLFQEASSLGTVAYVINTHEHGDHLAGNKHFDCPIICTDLARAAIVDSANAQLKIPSVTFTQRLTLYLGEPVELHCVGGHSPGCLVVYLPTRKVLFTGDLVFNGRMPYMGYADFPVWISALEELYEWDIELVIPGHGVVGNKEILLLQKQYLESFVGEVKTFYSQGLSLDDIFTKICAQYTPPERWLQMVRRAIELAVL
ncbi:MAG: MBL fold metallo-hydrolase [bacterium]|nr:MBL fold metallo-hydrolase [bacterium]